MTRILPALLLGFAAAAAAVAANLALLGYASANNDPVGKLRISTSLPAAPAVVVRPRSGPLERERADD